LFETGSWCTIERTTALRHPLTTLVEIRMEPGDVRAGLKSEMEAWDKASDESWKWIESLEATER